MSNGFDRHRKHGCMIDAHIKVFPCRDDQLMSTCKKKCSVFSTEVASTEISFSLSSHRTEL